MGKRVMSGWSKYHSLLWPRGHTLLTTFLDHGLGNISIGTTYMFSMIFWGFASPRDKWQRTAAAQFLTDLVHLSLVTRPGLQLYLPQPGAPPVDIDEWGCFNLVSVVDSAMHCSPSVSSTISNLKDLQSVLAMGVTGVTRLGQLPKLPFFQLPQQPFPSSCNRPHVASFVVAVLTPENKFSDWSAIAMWFLRQLCDVVNVGAAGMMQGTTLPPGKPPTATSDVDSASTTDQFEEDDSLTKLASVMQLEAALSSLSHLNF